MTDPARQPRWLLPLAALVLLAGLGIGARTWLAARTESAEQRIADEARGAVEALFTQAEAARRRGEPIEADDLLKRSRERLAQGAPSPRVRTEVLAALGAQLAAANQPAQAEAVLNEAVDLGRAELGDDHAQTDAARVQRAALYRAVGRQKEARVEIDALMPRLRDHVRSRPRDLVAALQVRAQIAGDDGKQAEATTLAREALAIADDRLGAADALEATSALALARALHQQKQDAAALAAAQDALARTERAFPGELPHPRRIEARTLLGRALAEGGQLERGIAELNAALDATRTLHGRDSLEAAVATQSLVAYQIDRGLLREANAGADEALRILLRVSLRRSYNVGAAFDARGVARLAARNDAEARDNLVIATQTLGVMIGHDHPATRVAKAHLAQALLAVEGARVAAEAVSELEVPATAADAAAQPYEAPALRVRAIAARLQGRAADALALLDRAATRIVPGHRTVQERAAIDVERGRALLDLGRAADARPVFAAAQQALIGSGSLPQPALADAQVGLGRALLALGDGEGALVPLQSADTFWRGFDAGNPWAAEALAWRAKALRAASRSADLAEADQRLAALLQRVPPGGHAVLDAIRAGR